MWGAVPQGPQQELEAISNPPGSKAQDSHRVAAMVLPVQELSELWVGDQPYFTEDETESE